jgi:hypothetical protein
MPASMNVIGAQGILDSSAELIANKTMVLAAADR